MSGAELESGARDEVVPLGHQKVLRIVGYCFQGNDILGISRKLRNKASVTIKQFFNLVQVDTAEPVQQEEPEQVAAVTVVIPGPRGQSAFGDQLFHGAAPNKVPQVEASERNVGRQKRIRAGVGEREVQRVRHGDDHNRSVRVVSGGGLQRAQGSTLKS